MGGSISQQRKAVSANRMERMAQRWKNCGSRLWHGRFK